MTRIRNSPPETTAFIGRQEELVAIVEMLIDPACRLLTLVGPGGIGKTRLATQAASKLPVGFKNGITFIALQPVQRPDNLVYAIADGLHLPLTEQDNPGEQLIGYLRNRETLLVLDSFDLLLSDRSVDWVLRTLLTAPGVKLLVTSREVLNLQEEWLFTVQGLPLPAGGSPGDLQASSAAQLFVERARQVRRSFSPVEEAASLARICRLTNGMPLALELAASWARILDCTTIADEIEANVNFLAARMRNVPERHRSIQAVFAHSWERLSETEAGAFKRLSIFRGGFQRHAATEVTGASLPVLIALVDKSLLRWEPEGRYRIHELLRQYGAEKLSADPSDEQRIRERFCSYYLDYVNERTDSLSGGRQLEATAEIESELENIRQAWNWIPEREEMDGLGKFVMTMSLFYQYRSRYLEGLAMLERGVERLERQPPSRQRDMSLASLQCDISWLLIRVGQLEKAEQSAQISYGIVGKYQALPSEAQGLHPLLPLGIIASIRGDYGETTRMAEMVRQESEEHNHSWNRQFSTYLLTRAALLQGDIENAQRYAQEAYALTQANQDLWFMAYCLSELGNVACELGDSAAAREYYESSYELRRDFDDPEGMAAALNNLGSIELQGADYARASEHFRAAETIYQEIDDKGGLATSLFGIARISAARGQFQSAQQVFKRALEIAADIQYYSLCTSILVHIGELLLEKGEADLGIEILEFVAAHPASERETVEHARRLIPSARLPTPEGDSDLGGIVASLLARFPELGTPTPEYPTAPVQPLIDPLTERELEVLAQIADGLTNQQIAETLFISTGTAKWYASQIYRKLGVKNRTQAVARARELNLIDR